MRKENSGNLSLLFFGIGSIGKKHIKIIKDNFDFDIYAYRTKKGQEKNDLKIRELDSLEHAFSIKPDIAFITNPTFLHVDTALECAKRNIDLFIEKPISHSMVNIDKLNNEIKKRKLFTYVAYNMRFHPIISNLKEMIAENEKPNNFKVKCSSYLPDWRPNQDYSKSYSAKKELGGGVILDVSHEFDYISGLFGEIKKIDGYCDKISNLKINCEDFVDAKITCASNIEGNLQLDCFSHNNERKIKIYYDDKHIEGDLIKNTIKITKKSEKEKKINYTCNINDTYKKQIEYFFEQYSDENLNIMNNFSEALKTFKKIMEFKRNCN